MRIIFILLILLFGNHLNGQDTPKKLNYDIDDFKERAGLKLVMNDTAKNFTVKMINGDVIKLSDLKGKVVLLNFWATWCGPCIAEFKEIPDKILEPFKDEDFVFLSISRGEREKKVRKKMVQLKEYGINFNVGIDREEKIWDMYGTKYIPKNFIIDKNGVIKFISQGYSERSLDKIAKWIKELLHE